MRNIIFILMLLFLFNESFALAAQDKGFPAIDQKLLEDSAWLDNQNGDVIILDSQEINTLNRRMLSDNMPDLQNYPTYITRERLESYLREYEFGTDLYVNGKLFTTMQVEALTAEQDSGDLADEIKVQYGVVALRSNLRSLPTNLQAFSDPADKEFDMWQETAVDSAEPLLILHFSKNKDFAYVQMRNYRGWLPSSAIALTDRDTWLRYVCPEKFAIVTGKLMRLSENQSSWVFQMGSRIPTEGKMLLLPLRERDGNLKIVKLSAIYSEDLHAGYLPYTTNNLIKQAFKFIDSPYGWGGLHESVDCSSFVADVYRTVGVELPRNADEQEEAYTGATVDLSACESDEKLKIVNNLPIGSALFMPNHVMIYLGSKKGDPYIIHALGSFGARIKGGAYRRVPVMKVVVSDLFLTTRSGNTFLEKLTGAQSYR
ncbi:MAG: SH3 domain-containing protein [Acidaminococcaceae bacterium]